MGAAVEDLELSVRRDGDALAVRVAASPAGTTFEQRTSVADLDRLLALDGGRRRGDARHRRDGTLDDGPALVGETLFRAVFRDAVGDRFRVSCDRAAASGAALRLVLTLDSAADALPWELLADPEAGRPLALRHPIVRSLPGADDPRPAIEGPLRVLAVVATPVGTAPLDTAAELRRVRDALHRFVESRAIDLRVVTATSFGDLTRALEDGPWHVVHYVGHGTRQPDGTGALVLHDDATGHDVVTGAALGATLTATGDVRLVVLNACHTATADGGDPFAGTASALVRAGVPTVVAMRRAITDAAAVAFAGALYAGLVGGSTVEAAVTSARRVLHGSQRSGTEWATPVVCTTAAGRRPCRSCRTPTTTSASPSPGPPGCAPTHWETMLVLAHRSGPYVGARGETVDPGAQVEARIQTLFGADAPAAQRTTVTSAGAIPRGTELVVAVDVPGVETIVRDSPATWRGDLAEVLVQLRAPAGLVGQSVEVGFACSAGRCWWPKPRWSSRSWQTVPPCRRTGRRSRCAASGGSSRASHRPMRELVRGLAATAAAMGDVEYVAGVFDDDPQAPDQWMVTALRDADVFQLFWSTSSMTSERCRRQWQAAVALDRPDFVRPLYWERPMPRAPDLPPPELDGLRFVAIPVAADAAGAVASTASRRATSWSPQPASSVPGRRPVAGQRTISRRTSAPPPPGHAAARARARPAGSAARRAAALVLLGGLVGLVVGSQSTVSQGAEAGHGIHVRPAPARCSSAWHAARSPARAIAWRHRRRRSS